MVTSNGFICLAWIKCSAGFTCTGRTCPGLCWPLPAGASCRFPLRGLPDDPCPRTPAASEARSVGLLASLRTLHLRMCRNLGSTKVHAPMLRCSSWLQMNPSRGVSSESATVPTHSWPVGMCASRESVRGRGRDTVVRGALWRPSAGGPDCPSPCSASKSVCPNRTPPT